MCSVLTCFAEGAQSAKLNVLAITESKIGKLALPVLPSSESLSMMSQHGLPARSPAHSVNQLLLSSSTQLKSIDLPTLCILHKA
jgi:hypothetical protein